MSREGCRRTKTFYQDVLGLDMLMDHGWIALRLAGEDEHTDQLCFRGRRRHAVPDLSIEVDEIEAVLEEMRRAGFSIEYGPVDEPWGVRRFLSAIRSGSWSTS